MAGPAVGADDSAVTKSASPAAAGPNDQKAFAISKTQDVGKNSGKSAAKTQATKNKTSGSAKKSKTNKQKASQSSGTGVVSWLWTDNPNAPSVRSPKNGGNMPKFK